MITESYLTNYFMPINQLLIKTKKCTKKQKKQSNFINDDELSTEYAHLVGMLWQQTLSDESEDKL